MPIESMPWWSRGWVSAAWILVAVAVIAAAASGRVQEQWMCGIASAAVTAYVAWRLARRRARKALDRAWFDSMTEFLGALRAAQEEDLLEVRRGASSSG